MKCPKDGTTLAKVEFIGTELDKCHKCDGIRFDRGELERIRDSRVTDAEEELERKYGDPQYAQGETEGYMRCPRCEGRLQRFSYAYIAAVYIDRCDKCFGVWLDDGELNSIVRQKKAVDVGLKDVPESLVRCFVRSVGKCLGCDS